MAKGLFSQCMCLLTDSTSKLTDIKAVLKAHKFEVLKEVVADGPWQFGGAAVVISYRPEINGFVSIDLVNEPWPDAMGDPKAEPTTFGAWSMGYFGPWAYPNSLERAGMHAWAWAKAGDLASGHKGFIRIRLSYGFGASDDSPVLPEGYDALDEMNFVSRVTLALLDAPGVICYFNPNGEVLRDRASFNESWAEYLQQQVPALPLWSNIRFFELDGRLSLMDTNGNRQLDVMDIEAVFSVDDHSPESVDGYLRNVSLYLIDSKPHFESGQTIDGPDDKPWMIEVVDDSLIQPPRDTLRIYPVDIREEVLNALADLRRE